VADEDAAVVLEASEGGKVAGRAALKAAPDRLQIRHRLAVEVYTLGLCLHGVIETVGNVEEGLCWSHGSVEGAWRREDGTAISVFCALESQVRPMLHMMKMAVGIEKMGQLRAWQRQQAARRPPLRHQTRTRPSRTVDLLAGGSIYWVFGGALRASRGAESDAEPGSIYWVFGGALRARQRLLDVVEDVWDDGSPCVGLVLDPALVEVEARPQRPFRGWRYLEPLAVPPDLAPGRALAASEEMPETMRRELRALGLL